MITAAVVLAIVPLLLVTAFFSVEVAAGIVPMRDKLAPPIPCPPAVIVIPAHDEAAVIGSTLKQASSALSGNMEILVVADNCSDSTAECARAEGVRVVERCDPARRGKGYALHFALEQLKSSPPEIIVVLDADCWIEKASLRRLVQSTAETGRPSQAVNLLRPDRTAAPFVQISGFAFMVKNLVRQRGLQRLSGRVHLTGTGMAMPFRLLASSSIANSDIVEDLSLGLEMSARGYPPELCSEALVMSSGAPKDETLVQRRRWEGGFIATSFRRAPVLALSAIRGGDPRSLLAALDLMVPPLALLALLNVCALVALGVIILWTGVAFAAFALDAVLLALAAVLVTVAWAREGRDFVSLSALAKAPLYVAWKLPLYLSLARRGAPREWLRTRR